MLVGIAGGGVGGSTGRFSSKEIVMDCQLCDTSIGTALQGKSRPDTFLANLVARVLRVSRPVACDECWFGRASQSHPRGIHYGKVMDRYRRV
ncbi:hypothetical protein LCGC14_0666770 [marine sediment metagenome]|uniref:Uncharacterized protein n=1 Tax=marine sediment metagenome TaxID=412755 RepID=A0A0F9U097_9ZZZZ